MTASLFSRWLSRLRAPGLPPTPATPAAPAPEVAGDLERLAVDEVRALQTAFAAEFPVASGVTDDLLPLLTGADLTPLARRSPSLAGYDWSAYLRCSVCRLVRFQRVLTTHLSPGARVLDCGSYFGTAGLVLRRSGFVVDAIDSYRDYGESMARFVRLQRDHGIAVHDFADAENLAALFGPAAFDAVLCAGVIEHIPHTPRQLLEALVAVTKPGGLLVLDTPNLGYLYKRLVLLEGNSIFAPISQQFYTDLPFEGHHREYTVAEIEWMLQAVGLEQVSLDTFNYSNFGQTEVVGDHAVYYRAMQSDPLLREVILAVARRPADD